MEEDQDFMPFWLPTTPRHRRHSLHHSTSSLIFSSGGFLLLLVAALAFIFVIIPSLHSFTGFMSHIFKPNSVKKSWDSLNLVLVLFAVLCGFLGRNAAAANNDGAPSYTAASAQVEEEVIKSGPLTARQWYEYSDQTVYNDRGVNRMRSSSSYPDLRQDSETVFAGDERWQSNDTHVSNYQVSHSGQQVRQQLHHRRASWHEEYNDVSSHVRDYRIPDGSQVRQQQQHRRRASWHDGEFDDVTAAVRLKNIPVDTFVIRTERASSSSSDVSVDPAPVKTPSPPNVAAPPVEQKRIYESVGKRETITDDLEAKSSSFRQPATVAATQSPEAAELPKNEVNSSQKREKNVKNKKKKKTGGVATTKEFITSLRRNKKRRQKSIEDLETQLSSAATSSSPPPIPPPPPPPPPSVFHTLFQSKKPKPTKTHRPIPHPPPSPPPLTSAAARVTSATSMMTSSHKPPLPLKLNTFNLVEEEAANSSGGESPQPSGIPPPPPFRMQAMKFVKHGDFVRVKSDKSARSSDDEEGDVSPMSSTSRSGFCPSPDVNTKADTFIARFRAGLKLEKMNSVNQRGRSNLGPG